MKIIKKQPRKLKELWCVLLGHNWREYGSKKCLEHSETYNEHNVCSRCGLENHSIEKYCRQCYDKFMRTKIAG